MTSYIDINDSACFDNVVEALRHLSGVHPVEGRAFGGCLEVTDRV